MTPPLQRDFGGDPDLEIRAYSFDTFYSYFAVMGADDFLDNGKSKPAASGDARRDRRDKTAQRGEHGCRPGCPAPYHGHESGHTRTEAALAGADVNTRVSRPAWTCTLPPGLL